MWSSKRKKREGEERKSGERASKDIYIEREEKKLKNENVLVLLLFFKKVLLTIFLNKK